MRKSQNDTYRIIFKQHSPLVVTMNAHLLSSRTISVRPCRSLGCRPATRSARLSVRSAGRLVVRAEGNQEGSKSADASPGFGHTRADVIIIGAGLIGLGYALYYGLQAMGMEAGYAGNWVQMIIFLGICVGWVSTYFWRVATKNMTYVKQLEEYEEAVMAKRLEEMPEAEMADLMTQIEKEKEELQKRRAGKL